MELLLQHHGVYAADVWDAADGAKVASIAQGVHGHPDQVWFRGDAWTAADLIELLRLLRLRDIDREYGS